MNYLWSVCVVLWWKLLEAQGSEVTIGGLFDVFTDQTNVSYAQSQYLAAFHMAVDEINNKTDGMYDSLLPEVNIKIVVRHSSSANVAQAAVDLIQNSADAVISTVQSEFTHEFFAETMTPHFITQPDLLHHHAGSIYLYPTQDTQAHIWQSGLCQVGFTSVSLFYMSDHLGTSLLEDLVDGTYCAIDVASAHSLLPYQNDFTAAIVEAYESLSAVQMFFIDDVAIAAPLLKQAHRYGLIRQGHITILSTELMKKELWEHIDEDVADILRGSLGIFYAPEIPLHREVGQSFQQRFRNRPSTLIDGVCDASVDDSDSTHYLYRSEDGSLCAGLNHSSIESDAFDPLIGLVYDAVIAAARGMHDVLYFRNTSLTPFSLVDAVQNVTFEGVSGKVNFMVDRSHPDCLARNEGFSYKTFGFSEVVYESSDAQSAYVWVGTWDDRLKVGSPCDTTENTCYTHVYNTEDGTRPALPRYISAPLPYVLKIGVLVNTFNEDGSVNAAGVQQLAAFLMAVKDINDKSDGVADDVLPYSKIVLSVRSAHDLISGQEESMKLATVDFGTGAYAVISGVDFFPTLGTLSSQRTFLKLVINAATNYFLLDDVNVFPYKLQTLHASTYYGTVLQSLLCDTYKYRKIAIFVDNDHHYLDVMSEFLSGEFCIFNVISQHKLSQGGTSYKREIAEAKEQGARIFVVLTSAKVAGNLLYQGRKAGLFGLDRQVFGHADLIDLDISLIHVNPKDDAPDKRKMFYGFVGVRPHLTYGLNATRSGRAFVERWRKQPATVGVWEDDALKCNMQRDDNDYFQLYSSKRSFDAEPVCAGLNFSSFAADGSDIHSYVPQAYDSMMLLARGFHMAMHVLSPPSLDPFTLYDLVMQQVEFDGATGHVKMYYRDDQLIYLGKGSKRQGEYFEVVNVAVPMMTFIYNDDAFGDENMTAFDNTSARTLYTNGSIVRLNHIGVWEIGMGYVPCDLSQESCYTPVYNTRNNDQVQETPPPTLRKKRTGGYYAVAAVLTLITCIFANLYLRHCNTYIMSQAQSGLLPYILLGALCIAAHVVLTAVPFNTTVCSVRNVFFHVGMVTFFGPLVISSFRIYHNMWNSTPATYISQQGVVIFQACLIAAFCIILLARVVITSEANMEYSSDTHNNKEVRFATCSYDSQYFHIFLVVFEAIFLLFGLFVSSLTKDYEDDMGEVGVTYYVILVMCMVSFVVYPAWALLDVSPEVQLDIAVYNIAGVFILCLAILLAQKHIALQQYFSRMYISKRRPAEPFSENESTDGSLKLNENCIDFKALSREDRIAYIRKQITKWITIFNLLQQTNRERYWDSDDSCNEFSSPNNSTGGVLQRLFSEERKSGLASLDLIAE